MSLPTSYLTSVKNIGAILQAMQTAQAPEKFTVKFLNGLGFKTTSDRLVIAVLKSLGFLDETGKPLDPYFQFLDQSQSGVILARAIENAYSDLFQVQVKAHELSQAELVNKFKTLTEGKHKESVITKMAATFFHLCKHADFSKGATTPNAPVVTTDEGPKVAMVETVHSQEGASTSGSKKKLSLGGVHYNIQLILPESRDQKVYDVLFRSLKEHLID